MSEQVRSEQLTVNAQFLELLNLNPDLMRKFLEIIKAWWELQGQPVPLPAAPPTEGPHAWHADTPIPDVAVMVPAISNQMIDALVKAKAEAVVKEKFLAMVQGFLFGITVASAGFGGPIGLIGGIIGTAATSGGAAADGPVVNIAVGGI
jgi:hypothetical protein